VVYRARTCGSKDKVRGGKKGPLRVARRASSGSVMVAGVAWSVGFIILDPQMLGVGVLKAKTKPNLQSDIQSLTALFEMI